MQLAVFWEDQGGVHHALLAGWMQDIEAWWVVGWIVTPPQTTVLTRGSG